MGFLKFLGHFVFVVVMVTGYSAPDMHWRGWVFWSVAALWGIYVLLGFLDNVVENGLDSGYGRLNSHDVEAFRTVLWRERNRR